MNCKKEVAVLYVIAIISMVAMVVSCYTPSPLYGTWADNTGSKVAFVNDGTYTATIIDSASVSTQYSGTWSVIDNVLIFTKESGSTIDTEWDIRGAMLYLDWTDDEGDKQSLTLYHISK